MDIPLEFINIEKYLFPKLGSDPWERTMYFHLLINTRLIGIENKIFSVDTLASTAKMNPSKVRETIRNLDKKGAIIIVEKNRNGHLIKALFPSEIEGLLLIHDENKEEINIEDIDFYKGRKYLTVLMERDNNQCIYCLKAVTTEKAVLDHIISLANGGNNSYKNIGISCHECNSRKGDIEPIEFIRLLYRNDMLSESEFQERKDCINKIISGAIKPRMIN